jgi:predicted Zn-dependent peptidase
LDLVKKYFGDIPSAKLPQPQDISEPRQEKEKIFSKEDKLATKPALAFAYHAPDRLSPEYFAMGIIDQILLQGEDSWLYQSLVQTEGITDNLSGGINALLGNMYNYNGPILWFASFIHDKTEDPDSIINLIDLQIDKLQHTTVSKEILNRAMIKLRADYYQILAELFGFGRTDLLACFALFDDNPHLINNLEEEFRKVTPEIIQRTAREYLRATNRTVLKIIPTSLENEEN